MAESVVMKDRVAVTQADVAALRASLEEFESRMAKKAYAAVGAGVCLMKALDLLVG